MGGEQENKMERTPPASPLLNKGLITTPSRYSTRANFPVSPPTMITVPTNSISNGSPKTPSSQPDQRRRLSASSIMNTGASLSLPNPRLPSSNSFDNVKAYMNFDPLLVALPAPGSNQDWNSKKVFIPPLPIQMNTNQYSKAPAEVTDGSTSAVDMSKSLASLARELSTLVPAQPPTAGSKEDDEFALHAATLGITPKMSTGTSRSHRRAWSVDVINNNKVMKEMEKRGTHNLVIPPIRTTKSHDSGEHKSNGIGIDNKIIPISCPNHLNNRSPFKQAPMTSNDSVMTPTSTPLHVLALRTTEREPSPYQLEIPQPDDILLSSRICAVMEEYRLVDQHFDFSQLTGLGHVVLSGFATNPSSNTSTNFQPQHRPIIMSIQECADDIVVEGFFVTKKSKTCHDRLEVGVFSSHRRRCFIVCYRGTTEQQSKPIRNREVRQFNQSIRGGLVNLHVDHPVPVFPTFKSAYFTEDIESEVFALLAKLTEEHPFCDLITTGHSFGGGLAIMMATRYASIFPMMRVNCHAFGSPKIGGKEFREFSHSLPNLRTFRVEYGSDPWVDSPQSSIYCHVGHTIRIPHVGTEKHLSKDSSKEKTYQPIAFKFDKGRPKQTGGITTITKKFSFEKKGHGKKEKTDHEIRAYVHAMERFTHRGMPWVKGYVGETGKGVQGKGAQGNGEKRTMV